MGILPHLSKNKSIQYNKLFGEKMKYYYFITMLFIILSGCVTSVNNKNDLTEVKRLYDQTNYSEARDLCEKILINDPYNQKGIESLKKIYLKLREISLRKIKTMKINDIDASEWSHISGIDFIDENHMTYTWGD